MSRVKIASHRVRETVQYLYIKRSQRRFFFFFQQSFHAYCVSRRLEITRGTNRSSSSVLSIINRATLFFLFSYSQCISQRVDRARRSFTIFTMKMLNNSNGYGMPTCLLICFSAAKFSAARDSLEDPRRNWIKILAVQFQSLDVSVWRKFYPFRKQNRGNANQQVVTSITGQHNENLQCREIVVVEWVGEFVAKYQARLTDESLQSHVISNEKGDKCKWMRNVMRILFRFTFR